MAEDTSLSQYLDSQRANGSPCFCATAPPEIVAQIDAAVNSGSRQWAAMMRWLTDQDVKVTKQKLADHLARGHVK